MQLYLASTSPARRALLRSAGVEPKIVHPEVDEEATVRAAEAGRSALDAPDMVQLLARAKAEAACGRLVDGDPIDGFIVGGDSAFEFGGTIFGKPHRVEVAKQRWLQQRGATGVLHSGHWLIDHRGGVAHRAVGAPSSARVTFADDIADDELDAYLASGEPLEVAGAFTIDSLGGPFITRIEGDPSTVVGLSLPTLRKLFLQLGVRWPSLWSSALL